MNTAALMSPQASALSSSSAPVLPVLRQPSPLSFDPAPAPASPAMVGLAGTAGLDDAEMYRPGDYSLSLCVPTGLPTRARTPSSPTPQTTSARPPLPGRSSSTPSRSRPSPSPAREDVLPLAPQPDSLLLRSTFAALDHSASVLKRLSKSALGATAAYFALLDQLERTEDELFRAVGELGRWLESGYGLEGPVWDAEDGVRKARAARQRKEREEIRVLVEGQVQAVRAELKRNGLAGGGAQTRYEADAKQFYVQTGAYLAPQTTPSGPASHAGSHAMSTSPNPSASSGASYSTAGQQGEMAQSARLLQFDLTRYNHHTALLYAVPPSSVSCLDLLVSLYTWAASVVVQSQAGSGEVHPTTIMPKARLVSDSSVSTGALSQAPGVAGTPGLKASITDGLTALASRRAALLEAWAARDDQSASMERAASLASAQSTRLALSPSMSQLEGAASRTSVASSAAGIEFKRPKRHRIHRSVGGRLMGLLTPSSSTTHLSADRLRGERASLDLERPSRIPFGGGREPTVQEESGDERVQSRSKTAPIPPAMGRPGLNSRHSMQHPSPANGTYAAQSPYAGGLGSVTLSSPDLRLRTAAAAPSTPAAVDEEGLPEPRAPALSDSPGDEDERRGEVGRKREGVLWSPGVWEEVSKGVNTSKGKWERVWVVLDHSSVFEYRNIELGKSDVPPTVVDLKFASVRETRGGDRRFVFEIVTPKLGRRLYQATSERETQDWIYALTNAIESCINGTSSIRTFDASKLRSPSGTIDDYGAPAKRTFPSFPSRPSGLSGLVGATPGSRRSMPPPSKESALPDVGVRQRKTSMKKIFRQSADAMGEKWDKMRAGRASFDLPRPTMPPSSPSWLAEPDRDSRSSYTTDSVPAADRLSATSVTAVPLTASPTSARTFARSSIVEHMNDEASDQIERRVLQMSGLGLGSPNGNGSGASDRRIHSEGQYLSTTIEGESPAGGAVQITRSRSANGHQAPTPPPKEDKADMALLRRVADEPANQRCADCGKGTKSSRWATISLHDRPVVLFLCIRCCGIHRSLGTHISKPRSVDMDRWAPETILSAQAWGNARGNEVWERNRPDDTRLPAGEEGMKEYITAKYVEGRWLSEEDKRVYGISAA